MASDLKLKGKTAIVTGGAGGLGKAIAAAFLGAGANVVVCDINESRLQECSAELAPKGPFHTVVANVTEEESVEALFKAAIEKFGTVDILVNNAGVIDRFEAAAELDRKLWDRVLAINLTGPFLATKHAVSHFLAQGDKSGGSIINIGSVASQRGASAGAAYTATKHGLIGLTKNTAASYGDQNIRCNVLMPGSMETNIGATLVENGMNEAGFERLKKVMAVGAPYIEIEKVGKLCVHLASDDGAILNGATISADKGWCAH